MILADLHAFIKSKRLAVISSTHKNGHPQAALIGYAFDPIIGLVFDTSANTRKTANLRARPYAALVIGWDEETTVQVEGTASEPTGAALTQAKSLYFATWPDGRNRESWPDISYFVIKPHWMRYSRYTTPPEILDFHTPELS